jgi:hypothetical protein
LPDTARLTKDLVTAVDKLHNLSFEVTQAVPAYIGRVRAMAKAEEETRRMWYSFCNILSYVLYPVGWLLTFRGALLEPERKEEVATEIG